MNPPPLHRVLLGISLPLLLGSLIAIGPSRPRRQVDPGPLGAPARIMQGPLAAGRALLVPFAYAEMEAMLRAGRHSLARRAARRLLTTAPWLSDIWIHVAWSRVFAERFTGLSPTEQAREILEVQDWLSQGAAVLPGNWVIPLTMAFIISERIEPMSSADRAWTGLTGSSREEAILHWLQEGRRRAPDHAPILSRLSAVALTMAAKAWRRGRPVECAHSLGRAIELERRLAARGSESAATWVRDLERLRTWARSPFPWDRSLRERAARTAPGLMFLQAAGT